MDTTPYWIDSALMARYPEVQRDLEVDVVVIGGGIMGLTAAYLLKQTGRTVALVERGLCARGDSARTTAHITAVTDRRLTYIADIFGEAAARAVWDAGCAAIDQIVSIIRTEEIACDFRWVPGFLHAPLDGAGPQHVAELREEARQAQDLEIGAEFVHAVPFFSLPGIRYPQQALFHPRKYLATLAQRVAGKRGYVFERSEVSSIEPSPLTVRVGAHRLRCGHVVMATHNPLVGTAGVFGATLFQSKLALYSTYVVGAQIPAQTIPEALFWDTAEPYNYLRVEKHRGCDYAIFGGEDHKTGQQADTAAAYRRLEERLLRLVPEARVDHRWSGQVIESTDGLPFIGELAPNQFAATGFAGNGMTFGTLGAMMATDAVFQRRNPWQGLFEPGRKKIRGSAWSYVKENKDYPYYLVRDWLGGTEGRSLTGVKRGEGKILNLNGRKVAAYRNIDGEVSLCSPVCTHLKCIVRWNDAEQTWDCPCHGSRYKPTGEVISGPAEAALQKLPAGQFTPTRAAAARAE